MKTEDNEKDRSFRDVESRVANSSAFCGKIPLFELFSATFPLSAFFPLFSKSIKLVFSTNFSAKMNTVQMRSYKISI